MRRAFQHRVFTICAMTIVCAAASLRAQECNYVHPPAQPQASDFPQPPNAPDTHFRGPIIRPINAQCWYAEPSTPAKCIGGIHGVQKVTALVPIDDIDLAHLDTNFRQKTLASFSGGGKTSALKADELPAGFFVSFKGHPVYSVTKVQYPVKGMVPPHWNQRQTGVNIELDFEHEPTNGECYFYVALWVAVK